MTPDNQVPRDPEWQPGEAERAAAARRERRAAELNAWRVPAGLEPIDPDELVEHCPFDDDEIAEAGRLLIEAADRARREAELERDPERVEQCDFDDDDVAAAERALERRAAELAGDQAGDA